jgi:hypothetical protein
MVIGDDEKSHDGPANVIEPAAIEIDRDEVIEFGGAGPSRWASKPPWLRWSPLAVVALVVIGLAVHASTSRSPKDVAMPQPTGSVVTEPTRAAPVPSRPTGTAPVYDQVGHPLLGVHAGWELFALASTGVVRIQLAKGRVVTTPIPPLRSSGPVSFVVGPSWAMVRPLDAVPGYDVRDGHAATEQDNPFEHGGLVLPGPDLGHLWLQSGGDNVVRLVDLHGKSTGTAIHVPSDMTPFPVSDGAGGVLFLGTGGMYEGGRSGFTRVTTGTVVAVGRTRILTIECDDRHRCAPEVTDRASGAHRTLARLTVPANASMGVISPDGRTAAIEELDPQGRSITHLIDLDTGADRTAGGYFDQSTYDNAQVWSPDSAWLFLTDAAGGLYAIDRASGEAQVLGLDLPPVTQLAIRP